MTVKRIGPGETFEGAVFETEDPKDKRIRELELANEILRRERDDADLEVRRAREDANRALSMLRKQLTPLYRALQAVFGELDAAGVGDPDPVNNGNTDRNNPVRNDPNGVWAAWKQRLPPAVGKVIDALLIHGELSQTQIKVAAGIGSSTVTDCVYKLNKAGLIDKKGGRISLKRL